MNVKSKRETPTQWTGISTANVYSFPSGQLISDEMRPLEEIKSRLETLIRLDNGWDGYEGLPVSFENAYFAFSILQSTGTTPETIPQIVPGSSGDLQLEWYLPGGEIELHVRSPNNVHGWRCVRGNNPSEEEHELSTDFSLVTHWIRQLSEPDIAPVTATA